MGETQQKLTNVSHLFIKNTFTHAYVKIECLTK